jgi:cold shock CspA family protein
MVRVIRKKTGHLIEITRDDGTKDVSWDWDQLLEDVRAATEGKGVTVKVVEKAPKKPAAKKPAAKKPAAKKKKETK